MVDARHGSIGHGGRARRGRGRPRRIAVESAEERTADDHAEERASPPPADDQAPISIETRLGQLETALHDILSELRGGARSTAPTPEVPVQPVEPLADARPEKRIDWVKTLAQCRPPAFTGEVGEDIERWFREMDGLFDHVAIPASER